VAAHAACRFVDSAREKAHVTPFDAVGQPTPGVGPRVAVAIVGGLLIPALAGCGAGFGSAVDKVVANNAAGEVNGVLARAIVIVKGRQATAAALAGTLINRSRQDDVLQTIMLTDEAPGSATITVTPDLPLAAGQLLPLGIEAHQPITVPDARSIIVGDFVRVVMHFRQAGDLHLEVAAADRTYFYSDVIPTPPTEETQSGAIPIVTDKPATATPRPTGRPTARPTSTSSPTPTATARTARPTASPAQARANAPAAARTVPAARASAAAKPGASPPQQ